MTRPPVFRARRARVHATLHAGRTARRAIQPLIGLPVAIVVFAIALLNRWQDRTDAFRVVSASIEFAGSSTTATNSDPRRSRRTTVTRRGLERQTDAAQTFVVLAVAIVVDVVANLGRRDARATWCTESVRGKR